MMQPWHKRKPFRKGGGKKKDWYSVKPKFKPLDDYSNVGLAKGTPIYTKIPGFPRSRLCVMNYVRAYDLGGGAAYFDQYYAANSIYNITGASDTANGFTQWGSFYNLFTVLSSQMEVEVSVNSASAGSAAYCLIHLDNGTVLNPAYEIVIEQQNTTYRVIPPVQTAAVPVKLKSVKYNAKTFNGVVNVMDNQSLSGQMVNPTPAPPAATCFYNIRSGVTNSTTTIGVVTGIIKIRYLVYFSEPNDLSG